jgi:hypothetical protein
MAKSKQDTVHESARAWSEDAYDQLVEMSEQVTKLQESHGQHEGDPSHVNQNVMESLMRLQREFARARGFLGHVQADRNAADVAAAEQSQDEGSASGEENG